MKTFALFCFCFLMAQTVFSQSAEFYKKVLQDDGNFYNSSYIVLRVNSSVYNGKVIVTNGFLQYFLSETKKFNKKRYESFMMKLLLNNDELLLKNVTLIENGDFLKIKGFNSRGFATLRKVESVDKVASRGCESFIEYYFSKETTLPMIKNNGGFREWNAIVSKLFEWQISSFIDDYSGMLAIHSNSLKCSSI